MQSLKCFLFILTLIFLISGCLEEQDKPEPGKILQTYQPEGKTISYVNKKNEEIDRMEFFSHGMYRILEKDTYSQDFYDTRPIHCILVAIDKYTDAPLEYCKEDIVFFKQYLTKHIAAFHQKINLIELYDKNATWQNVVDALEYQTKEARQYSTTLFVFSGHGIENALNLFDKEIPIRLLQGYFHKIKSKRLLWIIDSCHSGAFAQSQENLARKSKSATLSQERLFPLPTTYSFIHCFVGTGKALLCSSKPGEDSKDGIFLRSLISHLSSLEDSTSLYPVVQKINERIAFYNKNCRPENALAMTPFVKLYGDFQIIIENHR
ncbi:MAG: caspase family protein [Candidatus Brocadiae bacterium]|nr:caspase family protein [Candidatus Brocadiia bacterium]